MLPTSSNLSCTSNMLSTCLRADVLFTGNPLTLCHDAVHCRACLAFLSLAFLTFQFHFLFLRLTTGSGQFISFHTYMVGQCTHTILRQHLLMSTCCLSAVFWMQKVRLSSHHGIARLSCCAFCWHELSAHSTCQVVHDRPPSLLCEDILSAETLHTSCHQLKSHLFQCSYCYF